MSMVGFPLLLIPLAIYHIIVLLMPGVYARRAASDAYADVRRPNGG